MAERKLELNKERMYMGSPFRYSYSNSKKEFEFESVTLRINLHFVLQFPIVPHGVVFDPLLPIAENLSSLSLMCFY
jgi:hypothetical protein